MRRLLLCSLLSLAPCSALLSQAPANSQDSAILTEAPVKPEETGPSPRTSAAKPESGVKISYSSCNVPGQAIALTFDDGPHAQNTPRLLDILKERKIRATFFVVGQNAAEYPDILKRIAAEGHELANHSYTHPLLASLGENAVRDQLERTHQAVEKATGVSMKLMRPPYGALSEPQRRATFDRFGYRVILWDVDPLDWKFRDAARVQREILEHTRPGSIILSHDIHKSTVDAMPATIDALTEKSFKFVTVSELIAMDKPAPVSAPAAKPAPKPVAAADAPAPAQAAARKSAKESDSEPAPKRTQSTGAPAKSKAEDAAPPAKTAAPMTQEELRKKWLQLQKQN